MISDRQLEAVPPAIGESVRAPTPSRLVKIGQLSEMLGVTRRAIRHYEQRGLVEAIRGAAGVRLFDERARRRLEWIAKLRLTGIGLRDIEEILSVDGSPGGRRLQLQLTIDKLNARAVRLRTEIGQIEAAVGMTSSALQQARSEAPVTSAS